MSKVNITNIVASSQLEKFLSPFRFQISLDVECPLAHPLLLLVTYVGCAENPNYDQTLEQMEITIDSKGLMLLEVETNSPDPNSIPTIEDLLGPTVVILSVLYKEKEFFRCSYFVNNNYSENNVNVNNNNIDLELVVRKISVDQPRFHLDRKKTNVPE